MQGEHVFAILTTRKLFQLDNSGLSLPEVERLAGGLAASKHMVDYAQFRILYTVLTGILESRQILECSLRSILGFEIHKKRIQVVFENITRAMLRNTRGRFEYRQQTLLPIHVMA